MNKSANEITRLISEHGRASLVGFQDPALIVNGEALEGDISQAVESFRTLG